MIVVEKHSECFSVCFGETATSTLFLVTVLFLDILSFCETPQQSLGLHNAIRADESSQ